jgi:hypothetical protein
LQFVHYALLLLDIRIYQHKKILAEVEFSLKKKIYFFSEWNAAGLSLLLVDKNYCVERSKLLHLGDVS